MHGVTTHTELLGHLGDRETISQDAEHGVITLFLFAYFTSMATSLAKSKCRKRRRFQASRDTVLSITPETV
jgi:hypothetical protein